jgi:hypothetical protein
MRAHSLLESEWAFFFLHADFFRTDAYGIEIEAIAERLASSGLRSYRDVVTGDACPMMA